MSSPGSSPGSRPVILVSEQNAQALERIRDELARRYASDYQLQFATSTAEALRSLSTISQQGDEVAGAGAVERREPASHEGHSAIPDGALVLDAALRELDGGVETLARDSDDRRDAAAAHPIASGDDANDEGGSRRVGRSGGYQRLQAFTGRKGLDPAFGPGGQHIRRSPPPRHIWRAVTGMSWTSTSRSFSTE